MTKKKEKADVLVRTNDVGMNYLKSLENDTKYETQVDPEGFYAMSPEHKKFVELFVQYKNLAIVSEILNLEPLKAKEYFSMYSTQEEIRRINIALYHRQVATNIIAFEDLGSYLTSWLIGADVPEADKLRKSEKLQVVKLLMDWHKTMKDIAINPARVVEQNFEEQIQKLNAEEIKALIKQSQLISEPAPKTKRDLINEINTNNDLTTEEIEYLETLSLKELNNLLTDD